MAGVVVSSRTAILRDRPGGKPLAKLKQGDKLFLRGGPGAWAEVELDGVSGAVSRRALGLVAASPPILAAPAPPSIPPEAAAADSKVSGNAILGPAGRFGTRHKLGMFNYGKTSLDTFFEEDPGAFPSLAESIRRVIRAVSVNEGKIEAINTWDNAILSCSIYQWTVSADAGAGELPHALDVLKNSSATAFDTYFGKYGLGVDAPLPAPGMLGRGFFSLDGNKLDTGAKKKPLRGNLWAYRFWRAAHDPEVRRAYVSVAIEQIGVFYRKPVAALGNRPVSDYITSEVGVAQLLDQHVNRPAHVPAILVKAIAQFIAAGGKKSPDNWTSADERNVINRYLALRAVAPPAPVMTNSNSRAEAIAAAVPAGKLSDKRGSFEAP